MTLFTANSISVGKITNHISDIIYITIDYP